MSQTYKPGDVVPYSGIYRVTHDNFHTQPHDVTCIAGKIFPPCRGCPHPRFELLQAAIHIDEHESFRRSTLGAAIRAAAIREVHKYR